MDEWQALRLKRANEHDIIVRHLDITDDSFIFQVQGVSGDYLIEIEEDVNLWPPRCDCEDSYWRPDMFCKHIILCLLLMGVDENNLQDCCWQPQQDELFDILSNAPDCLGCTLAKNHDIKTHTADK